MRAFVKLGEFDSESENNNEMTLTLSLAIPNISSIILNSFIITRIVKDRISSEHDQIIPLPVSWRNLECIDFDIDLLFAFVCGRVYYKI